MRGKGSVSGGMISVSPDVRSKEAIFLADMGRELSHQLNKSLTPFHEHLVVVEHACSSGLDETRKSVSFDTGRILESLAELRDRVKTGEEVTDARFGYLESQVDASLARFCFALEARVIEMERRTILGWLAWRIGQLRAWRRG